MYERFTDRARKVMQLACQEAQRFNHQYVGTEHILLGLVKEGAGVAANVLRNLDIDLRKIHAEIEKIIQRGPDTVEMGKLPQTPRAKKVIEYAIEEARDLNHNYVGTEHLLLGLIREQEGVASQVLMNLGLRLDQIREETMRLLGHAGRPVQESGNESESIAKGPALTLDRFGRDLTELARLGNLDPVVGRDDEIRHLAELLTCRGGRRVVLLGEPGVGKRSVVSGLARWVLTHNTAGPLAGWRVISLDLARLTLFAAEVALQPHATLRACLKEAAARRIVLFLESLVQGAGNWLLTFEQTPLLAVLAGGDLPCILAGTGEEWDLCLRRDARLREAFRPLTVAPLSVTRTVDVLRGLRDRFEAHHRVTITDGALEAAAVLSDHSIVGRCLPGKAIDVLDQAGAVVRMTAVSRPPDLRSLDDEIERLSQAKEAAVASQDFDTAAALRDRVDRLKKEKAETVGRWQSEVGHTRAVVTEETVRLIVDRMTRPLPMT